MPSRPKERRPEPVASGNGGGKRRRGGRWADDEGDPDADWDTAPQGRG
jgi:hypothetical protein